MLAEQYRDIDDPQTAHKKHAGGKRLHRKLHVRTNAVKVVIDSEKENDRSRNQNCQQSFQ